MVPHFVFLPRMRLPFTWYSWSLPTTANGIISCRAHARTHTHKNTFTCNYNQWRIGPVTNWYFYYGAGKQRPDIPEQPSTKRLRQSVWASAGCCCYARLHRSPWTHPYFVIDQPVVCVLVELFLRVNIDAVGPQLFPDLQIKQQKGNVKLATHTPSPGQPSSSKPAPEVTCHWNIPKHPTRDLNPVSHASFLHVEVNVWNRHRLDWHHDLNKHPGLCWAGWRWRSNGF